MEQYQFKVYRQEEPDKYGRDIRINIRTSRSQSSDTVALSVEDLKQLQEAIGNFLQELNEE